MRAIRRLTAASVFSVGLFAFGLAPGASASTVTPQLSFFPSDCTSTYASDVLQLTCTSRPANQSWVLWADCFVGADRYQGRTGNTVTGDGTSTLSYCAAPL